MKKQIIGWAILIGILGGAFCLYWNLLGFLLALAFFAGGYFIVCVNLFALSLILGDEDESDDEPTH